MDFDVQKKNRYFALASGALGLYILGVTFTYPLDSSYLLRALSLLLVVWSCVLFWRSRSPQAKRSSVVHKVPFQRKLAWRRPGFLMFIGMIVYVGLAKLIGFFEASAIYMGVCMFLLGQRNWLILTLLPVTTTTILYGIFKVALKVSIPAGYLSILDLFR